MVRPCTGRDLASDHKSVMTFKVSAKIYEAAINPNMRLDADSDGVACEKK
jgi:hypothetical protein